MKIEEIKDKYRIAGGCGKSRDEEHLLQVSMVRWFRLRYPRLRHCLFAVPNGGRRDAVTGSRLKAEGVLAGVSDLILLKSNRHHSALLIETKSRRGVQRASQKAWARDMTLEGCKYVIVRSLDDFIRECDGYLADM